MERNYDFSGYLYKNRGDADYPAYSYLVGNLTFSENVMINKDWININLWYLRF